VKERLTSLLLACAALVLFWALFFPKPGSPADEMSKPLTGDEGASGYLGLWRWLQVAHIPLVQLRQPYGMLLQSTTLPKATGNLLITTLPHLKPADNSEWSRLDEWVKQGNTVLVLIALDDTPRWAPLAAVTLVYQLQRLTRLTFDVVPDSGDAKPPLIQQLTDPSHPDLIPIGQPSLFEGVRRVATASDLPASRWRATLLDSAPLLELARRADTQEAAVWLKALGRGRLLISAYASPFTNQQLGLADNARWLSNILTWSLGPGGRVIFDDAHQGLVDFYDPAAFFGDPRLHRTLFWMVLLWLLFVLGSQALRTAGDPVRPIDDTAMLEASAGFLANILSPAAAGRRLLEQFFNQLRRRLAQPEDGQPVWDWLEAHARVRTKDLAELKQLYARAQSDRRLNLVRLQSLLTQLAGCIS
jgi:hypothetical protein